MPDGHAYIRTISQNLESVNTEDLYDLMTRIFSPFENNLGINSHMELYALGIESVKSAIIEFRRTGRFPSNVYRLPGLKSEQAAAIFFLLDGIGSTSHKLMQAIQFSQEDILALKHILLQIMRNQLSLMEKELVSSVVTEG